MDRTVEQQARRYLALFPAWMRADRGEEAIALVLDLLPPGPERLPLRSRLDLVRAGLHARRVGTPPLRVLHRLTKATGRSRGGPVDPQWRPWLAASLAAPRWRRAYSAGVGVAAGIAMGSIVALVVIPSGFGSQDRLFAAQMVLFWALSTATWWLGAPRWRTVVLLRNGFDPTTCAPLPPGASRDLYDRPRVAEAVAARGVVIVLAWALVTLALTLGRIAIGWVSPAPSVMPVSVGFGAGIATLVMIPALLLLHQRLRALPVERVELPPPGPWDLCHDQRRRSRLVAQALAAIAGLWIAWWATRGGWVVVGLLAALAVGLVGVWSLLRAAERRLGRSLQAREVIPLLEPGLIWMPPVDAPSEVAAGSPPRAAPG